MPHVVMASSITGEGALLSATPKKERAKDATGGLLREIGTSGLLMLKDLTSLLSMSRDRRAEVVGALREVADGRWDRKYGSDGAQTLTWVGKCGMLAGCTTAIDRAHAVMSEMGTRWLFVRLARADLDRIGASALLHMGREPEMRDELARATMGLLYHLPGEPHPVEPVQAKLIALANMVSQARSPVQRDYRGEIELVLDAEAPTRVVKQLGMLWRACGMLGLDEAGSWEVVSRAGLDSIPKLRGAVLRALVGQDEALDTTTVGTLVDHPTRSTRRALEDLTAHGVLTRISPGRGRADYWELTTRARAWYSTAEGVPEMATSPFVPHVITGGMA
jgi:hypothetical protein